VVEALLIVYLFYLGSELIIYRHKKTLSVERLSRACLVQIAGPCPAEPFQLVPAQLGLTPAGVRATETRPVRNNREHHVKVCVFAPDKIEPVVTTTELSSGHIIRTRNILLNTISPLPSYLGWSYPHGSKSTPTFSPSA
jgi:hypothetical protein